MGTAERRKMLMMTLCRRRHDTIVNLASEFGVSEKTIRRDIEALSLSEPVYTKTGRYDGGVFVMEGYYPDKQYFSEAEVTLLQKLYAFALLHNEVSDDEKAVFNRLMKKFIKPILKQKKEGL